MTVPTGRDDGETQANGRARWVLSIALPLLVTVLIAAIGWSIHQHERLLASDADTRALAEAARIEVAQVRVIQLEVLRRLAVEESRSRDLEIQSGILLERIGKR